jgi:hypothetical protein
MKQLLLQLEAELKWSFLKHQDLECAIILERLAPVFVAQTVKLARVRNIQAQSTAKRKSK